MSRRRAPWRPQASLAAQLPHLAQVAAVAFELQLLTEQLEHVHRQGPEDALRKQARVVRQICQLLGDGLDAYAAIAESEGRPER